MDQQQDNSPAPGQARGRSAPAGHYAKAWREGFAYGFRDALRLAIREIDDPQIWSVLAALVGRYELASGD